MSTWRYAKDNQPLGPIETSELQSLFSNGTLPPETLVWKEGMSNWAAAGTLAEFAASIPAGSAAPPPPLPSRTGASGAGTPPPLISVAAADSDAADIEKNKVFAVLAYIWLLFLVPLLAAPNSKFARYHTNQGVVLFISWIIAYPASILLGVLTFGIGFILVLAVWICGIVFMILGIINAASGQYKPLPLIGHFQLIK